MKYIDTTPTFDVKPRYVSATVMPLNEKVQVIVGSVEKIFDEDYVQAIKNGRLAKFKKSALIFESAQ